MSNAGAKSPQKLLEKLLLEIDEIITINDIGKEARLSDAKNTLTAIQADTVALRRVLIQHGQPEAPIQELGGKPLGSAIREKLLQIKRLQNYIQELEQLPDDAPTKAEDEDSSNGHKEAQDDEAYARLRADDSDDSDDEESLEDD